ncbi:MAG: hypothetical protein AB7H77_05295 [Bdellovibrionales bacterium]
MKISAHRRLAALAIAAIAFVLLLMPNGSASAADSQVFPPVMPGTTDVCPPNPTGYVYNLVWDGASNVECAKVPISCSAGQGLQYDGTEFKCITPCSGPSTVFIATGACPSGAVGEVGKQVTTQCDGSFTESPINTCGQVITISTTTQITCPVGETVSGVMTGGVIDSLTCMTNPSACSNYTCTAGGLVPSP